MRNNRTAHKAAAEKPVVEDSACTGYESVAERPGSRLEQCKPDAGRGADCTKQHPDTHGYPWAVKGPGHRRASWDRWIPIWKRRIGTVCDPPNQRAKGIISR